MGLSSEERFNRFFASVHCWREKLSTLHYELGETKAKVRATYAPAAPIVAEWIRRVDLLVGMQVERLNTNSGYWVLGENEMSFAGVSSQYHDLPSGPSFFHRKPEYESIYWWTQNADHRMTADRLEFHPLKRTEGAKMLALWWDAYPYLSSIYYAVNRYQDNLFPENVRTELAALVGESINRRFEVCLPADDYEEARKLELHLLLKHKVFHRLLDKAGKEASPGSYASGKFDGFALYEQVAKLNTKALRQWLEDDERDRWAESTNADEKQRQKREAENAGRYEGLYGPPEPPRETPPQPKKAKKEKKPCP